MEEKIEQQLQVQQAQQPQGEKEIDLRVVYGIIRKNLVLIVIVTVIFGIGAYFYSSFFISKQYSASAMIIVNNKSNDKNVRHIRGIHVQEEIYLFSYGWFHSNSR